MYFIELWQPKFNLKNIFYSFWFHLTSDEDKRGEGVKTFSFLIVYFPCFCLNIQAAPVYEVYISQLIRFQRLHFLSWCFIEVVVTYTDDVNPIVQSDEVEIIPYIFLPMPSWVCWSLCDIRFKDDDTFLFS